MQHKGLKLLTVNTHKGFTSFNRRFMLEELRTAIRATGADVVFLQEVLGEHAGFAGHQRFKDHWPPQPQYEYLAESIWHAHVYGRNAVYPDGHHGNALLTQFPVTRWHNYDISLSGIERRGLLHCELNVKGASRPLHTMCTHLSLRESHRQRQLIMLADYINEVPETDPLVLAGDFNDWRGRAGQVLQERAGLTEVFVASQGKSPRTFPAVMPILRLDRIYVRGAISTEPLALPREPWAKLSDHIPLMAEVTI